MHLFAILLHTKSLYGKGLPWVLTPILVMCIVLGLVLENQVCFRIVNNFFCLVDGEMFDSIALVLIADRAMDIETGAKTGKDLCARINDKLTK